MNKHRKKIKNLYTSARLRKLFYQLLKKVTPENIHPEVKWGKPVGNEVW